VGLLLTLGPFAAEGCGTPPAEEPALEDASREGGGPGPEAGIGDGDASRFFDAANVAFQDGSDALSPSDAGASDGRDARSPGADDAAVPDGGTAVDAAPLDADDGSSSGCPGLFCEDFEKGTIDPTIWSLQANGGQTVAVQTSVVAHGKYAAQFHANPNIVSYDFIITKNAPAALRGHHFGRAYFNVTPKPPAEHTEFLFAGTAGFPKLKYLEVAGIGTEWQLTYVDLVSGGESYASGGNAPDAKWICLEWEFNDTPDQATVFVNGVQSYARDTISFNGQTTGLVGGFADFGFGYYAWHPATYVFDVYYDDIVLSTTRVGCLAAP
jgi:hypothetical protein